MTNERHLERDLPSILGDLAIGSYPDYIDDVLATTAQHRQRPGWTFPERWLPVELVTTRVPTTRIPWRQIGVMALLALVIAAGVAIYAGSQQARLPAPFGPATNGVVAYSQQGDIYVADPTTGGATAISSGPETDLRPIFSPDGTKVVFERKVAGEGGLGHLYVASADGAGLARVTTQPLLLTPKDVGDPYQFSPDGRSLMVAARHGDEAPSVFVVATDGSGERRLDLGALADRVTSPTEATFHPPDGNEILFVATDLAIGSPGVYAVDLTSAQVRTIVTADPARALDMATWSPDGLWISYSTWDSTADALTVRTHIVRPDGTGDRVLPMPAGAVWDLGAAWSNDGTRLHLVRGIQAGGTTPGPSSSLRTAAASAPRWDSGDDPRGMLLRLGVVTVRLDGPREADRRVRAAEPAGHHRCRDPNDPSSTLDLLGRSRDAAPGSVARLERSRRAFGARLNHSPDTDAIPYRARPPWPCRTRGDRGPARTRRTSEARRS